MYSTYAGRQTSWKSYLSLTNLRAACPIARWLSSRANTSTTASLSASGEKKSTSSPVLPSSITSRTGAVSDATTVASIDMASSSDQDSTNGTVR